jgi:hypothetical protein
MLWAYQHLDDADANPPSAGARMWIDLARRQPGHFLDCLVSMEVGMQCRSEAEAPVANQKADAKSGADRKLAKRVRSFFIDNSHLRSRLTGDGTAFVSNLPRDAHIVGCKADASRDGALFFIHSESYPPVPGGEPIPELMPEYSRAK